MAGCGNKEGSGSQFHELRGLVLAVDSSASRLTIAHDDIPHYMKAMTMTFKVKDAARMRGIEPGDSVKGVLEVRRPDVWIDSLAILSKAPSDTHH